MATGFNPKDKGENDLIGNILSDENAQDFFNLRLSMGRSISAPPPGLTETLTSSTPDLVKNEQNDPTATKDYYYYYHSLKPHDPRLPKPKWKPAFYDHEHLAAHNIIQEGNSESGGTNPDDSGVDEFSSQFDQSMTLNTTKDTITKDLSQHEDNKGYYGDNNNRNMNQNQNRGYDNSFRQNQNNNYDKRPGHQNNAYHGQNRQHGYNQQRNQGQNHNHGHGHQMNQNVHPQQQYYPQEQQMGNYYGGNYGAPQMQPQAYYGMSPYQPQVFPYAVDPNMAPNMNPMNKFPQPYPYMAGNNMGQVNPMNPMYMNGNPYMNTYYPMGMQAPMPNAFPNNPPQNQPYGNKGQKPMNKPNYQKLDIKNVLANLLENCRDQNGSRLIQQHFEKASEAEREEMFSEIIPEASELMTDVFGNYVIQKMLELGTNQQRQTIFEALKGNVFELSQNTYGCRVIQKIMEEFKKTSFVQDTILSEISHNILFLIEDQNGNHVIQKCFETVPIDKLQFIINEVTNTIDKLAFHAYGCRVIQKILETAPEDRVEPMLNKLMNNALPCCQCQYGNYIMQHILEKGPEAEKEMLLDLLKKNFTKLSMNKFASNVTEKSARFGSQDFRHEVLNLLISTYYDNKIGLVVLMTHPYGNYVAQRLFEYSDDKVKRKVFDRLRQENLEEIKKNSYGRHVMTFIEKWMENQMA